MLSYVPLLVAALMAPTPSPQEVALPPAPQDVATYLTAKQVMDRFKQMDEKKESGIAIVAARDKGNLITVDLLNRANLVNGGNTEYHGRVTEIYYIISGTGTFVTGGSVGQPKASDLTRFGGGPGETGKQVGGEGRRVGPGDTVIVPSGLAHGWKDIDGNIKYLIFRVDADGGGKK
jgi:mannose-6-phosphate isomerase-like protein (cupin superfamily)